jgi:two-component system sensor histidine kinase BaeS
VALAPVLETVREFFAPVAEENGVALPCTPADSVEVLGDASWLHQLFSNLVANALRHTPAGGRIELRSRAAADGVEVVVADTGEGIAADKLERIFERFERIGPDRGDGFGLGLPIAREIARAHGGWIRAESEPGAGTRLVVWLPRAQEPDA